MTALLHDVVQWWAAVTGATVGLLALVSGAQGVVRRLQRAVRSGSRAGEDRGP